MEEGLDTLTCARFEESNNNLSKNIIGPFGKIKEGDVDTDNEESVINNQIIDFSDDAGDDDTDSALGINTSVTQYFVE